MRYPTRLVFQPASLDAPLAGQPYASSLADVLGEEDPQVEHTLDMESVAAHWDELPRREQKILLMRFYGDMTQAEIGQQLGISQMHVLQAPLARARPPAPAPARQPRRATGPQADTRQGLTVSGDDFRSVCWQTSPLTR